MVPSQTKQKRTQSDSILSLEYIRKLAFQIARSGQAREFADDIAQIVSIKAFEKQDAGERVTKGWVIQRAKWEALNMLRSENRLQERQQQYAEEVFHRQEKVWRCWHPRFGDLLLQVRSLLLLLDDLEQTLIRTLYLHGYSVYDARRALHLGLAAINILRARALSKLRRLAGVGQNAMNGRETT